MNLLNIVSNRALRGLWVALPLAISCASNEAREPDLPKQPDRWVNSIALDRSSKVKYVGKTRDYVITTVSEDKELHGIPSVSIGDSIGGLRIGAIRCSFHWRDASSGGEQYMWRGRWGCMAGRSQEEVESAVADNGDKRFDYVYVAPVQLPVD